MDQQEKRMYTDEERLKLAAELDKDLDDFIDSLEKRKYTEGWPEDKWQEEFEKHPFFMTKTPEPGEKLHPLLEGIQQLKYDPDENTPEDLATSYKEDGNFYFKNKNYKMAFYSFSEGLKLDCKDNDIVATLYNNRSAASFFLKNYRLCFNDCKLALKLNPEYDKVLVRAAHCCLELNHFNECLEYCDKLLEKDKKNIEILTLKQKCSTCLKEKEKDDSKKQIEEKKKTELENRLINEIASRGIKMNEGFTLENLEPHFPQVLHNRVFLDKKNRLIWPVIILYPEYTVMDFIQEFHEEDKFSHQMWEVLKDRPDWDALQNYKFNNVNLYFENKILRKILPINMEETLGNTLKSETFILDSGTPSFICFVKNSDSEKHFLKQY